MISKRTHVKLDFMLNTAPYFEQTIKKLKKCCRRMGTISYHHKLLDEAEEQLIDFSDKMDAITGTAEICNFTQHMFATLTGIATELERVKQEFIPLGMHNVYLSLQHAVK